jgi:hypothetical protein
MKQIVLLFLSLVFTCITFAQFNSLQDGNKCFANGDYACAIEKYKQAILSQDERQKKIAGDNLKQAEKCFELLRMADAAFKNKNFSKAKEYYQNILEENSKDEFVKTQLSEIKIALITLDVSRNEILFSNKGGTEIVNVTTEADSYTVGILPTWCTVQKFDKFFSLICTVNLSDSERIGTFVVSAGSKSKIINIRQPKEQVSKISVSNTDIFFNSSGGKSEKVFVNINTSKYLVSAVPTWCSVQIFKGYFIVTCNANYESKGRTDWFKLMIEKEEVRIYVTQAGNESLMLSNTVNATTIPTKKSMNKYFFMNIGAVFSDLEKVEKYMVTMGAKKFYFRVKFTPEMLGNNNLYSTNYLSNKLEITNSGRVNNFPASSGNYYVVSNQMSSNRQSATLGTSFGGKTIRLYLGAGYGERLNLWNLNLNSYSNNQTVGNIWATNINQSWKGIEAEGGLFLKLGHFNIMGGASAIFDSKQSSPYFDFHLGIGFSTR